MAFLGTLLVGIGVVSAARFGTYLDETCTTTTTKSLVFTDVCTWTSDIYIGSYALTLTGCNATNLDVAFYNLTGQAGCNGVADTTLQISSDCMKVGEIYMKGLDFTCQSGNTSYNLLAHFTPDCQDGGYAFSIQLGSGDCEGDSFAPGYLDWDTHGGYIDPYYMMMVYNTTNGTCGDRVALYETKTFPVQCLQPVEPFQNISVDIYQSFPIV